MPKSAVAGKSVTFLAHKTTKTLSPLWLELKIGGQEYVAARKDMSDLWDEMILTLRKNPQGRFYFAAKKYEEIVKTSRRWGRLNLTTRKIEEIAEESTESRTPTTSSFALVSEQQPTDSSALLMSSQRRQLKRTYSKR